MSSTTRTAGPRIDPDSTRSSAIRRGRCCGTNGSGRTGRPTVNRHGARSRASSGNLDCTRHAIADTSTCISPFSNERSRSRVQAAALGWFCRGDWPPTTARWHCVSGCSPTHRSTRSSVSTMRRGSFRFTGACVSWCSSPTPEALQGKSSARFGVRSGREIDDLPDGCEVSTGDEAAYPVRLSSRWIGAVGGPTRRIPDLRRPHDLALIEKLAMEHPRLGDRDGWHADFGRELNATEDRDAFGARGLPVLEGKHVHPFVAASGGRGTAHRAATRRAPAAGAPLRARATRLPRRLWRRQSHRRSSPRSSRRAW